MKRYRLADQAENDLRSIWSFVSERSLKGADRIIDGLFARFNLLARNPLLGEVRDDLQPGLRAFVFEKYLILYYPMQSGIEVVGIVHSAQDVFEQYRRGDR